MLALAEEGNAIDPRMSHFRLAGLPDGLLQQADAIPIPAEGGPGAGRWRFSPWLNTVKVGAVALHTTYRIIGGMVAKFRFALAPLS